MFGTLLREAERILKEGVGEGDEWDDEEEVRGGGGGRGGEGE